MVVDHGAGLLAEQAFKSPQSGWEKADGSVAADGAGFQHGGVAASAARGDQVSVESAIRASVNWGLMSIALFNRTHAVNRAGKHPYLTGIHAPMTKELTLAGLDVVGEIPRVLDGLYVRNGPNPVDRPNPARYHWFTGDGMVHGVRIADGQAQWYRNRWVRTSKVSKALKEMPAPGPRPMESAVNTNVVSIGGKIFALVEAGGAPVELDGMLGTLAHNPFGGSLQGAFSAHPHRDPDSGELHAVCYLATDLNHVHHVVVGADGRVCREEAVAVDHGPSIHDCAITARFVLVLDLPVTFSMGAALAGYEFPYRWNDQHKSRVGLLGRAGSGAAIVWCDVDPCYAYHPANAYDLDDGRLVVDLFVHNCNSYRDFRGPDGEKIQFERWTIDPATRSVIRAVIDDTPGEFPRIDERRAGRPYRYAYSLKVPAGTSDLVGETVIFKHDLQTGTREAHDFGAQQFPGEFVFIPRDRRSGEDEGWLMGLVVDMAGETTSLVILDAQHFTAPPVARILIPHRVPPGFHGNWIPSE
jgi:carotenoid cleavage dioxygenase